MTKALVIGTSYGGLEALKAIIPLLPKDFPLPVLVVLHIGDNTNDPFINYLENLSKLHVKEAEEKESISKGTVYFAPPNYHLLIEDDKTISLSTDPKVHHSRPAIDVLFESAAWQYKNHLIGVILTGLNQDGANGLKTIKEFGGHTIVETPDQAIASVMPLAAIETAEPDFILPLDEIAAKVIKLSANM